MTSTYALPLPPGTAPSSFQPGHRRFPSQFVDPQNPHVSDRIPLHNAGDRSSSNLKSYQHNHTHDSHLSTSRNGPIDSREKAPAASHFSTLLSPAKATGISSMPTKGRPRGESDLGRPSLNVRTASSGAGTLPATDEDGSTSASTPLPSSKSELFSIETLTGFLLPLPFLVFSLRTPLNISSHHHHSSRLEVAEEVLEDVASSASPVPDNILNVIDAFLLTSVTLLFVALWGHMRQPKESPKKRRNSVGASKDKSMSSSLLLSGAVRKTLLRIAYVGLPYLATVELGGVRTGTVLLAAAASGLFPTNEKAGESSKLNKIRTSVQKHKWTCAAILPCLAYDLVLHNPDTEYSSIFKGYLALAKYVFLLNPPFSNSNAASKASPLRNRSATTTTWDISPVMIKARRLSLTSPLVSSSQDVRMTLLAGSILAGVTFVLAKSFAPASLFTLTRLTLDVTSAAFAAGLLIFAQPSSLRTNSKFGFAAGLAACCFFGVFLERLSIPAALVLASLSAMLYAAVQLDTRPRHSHTKVDDHSHHGHHHHHSHAEPSRFTQFLLSQTESSALLHNILADKESRRILYFMSINLGFMFVQTFYAVASGSLGLLSDSIHMFFDCVGLLAGLVASIMSKWPPNSKFPYGYGKVETLSGLGNGIFLMIISVEIIWESFERFMEGSELHRLQELMIVSCGGLAVNLIGLVFIGHAHHGHDHSHGGHSHSHDDQDHSHANGSAHKGHSHSHGGHSHSNENMLGIYLHILADTMGSVAVIGSTILTVYTGWSGWDPIASCVIAILIIAASYPLVTGSARRLLLTMPGEIEYALRNTLQELSSMRGVSGYAVPRFWVDETAAPVDEGHHHHHSHSHAHDHSHNHEHSHKHDHSHEHTHDHTHTHAHAHPHDPSHKHTSSIDSTSSVSLKTPPPTQKILGVIHIIATRLADLEDVRARVDRFLQDRNIHAVVHVEREGVGQCWCGGIGGHAYGSTVNGSGGSGIGSGPRSGSGGGSRPPSMVVNMTGNMTGSAGGSGDLGRSIGRSPLI
ncbi:MAG: putative zinc transporter msc2 [Chrysothrix sp. TS-e1954]|nr:MAG: putative zinc transporter msc2 [Chrysothrix sp. TS-e1954]